MDKSTTATLAEQWQQEFELTPPEHRRMLLKLAHSFRQSLTEDDAPSGFSAAGDLSSNNTPMSKT